MGRRRSSSAKCPDELGGYDGVLLVDKPSGMTSHDVVARIRRHFGFHKVGHGGTLDPMATGLLLILIGRGTKLSQFIMGGDKGYQGTMCLGKTTDTQDADGELTDERDYGHITREALEEEMKNWTGDILQTPPMVSAIKKDGVPLYKLARKGKTVEREPRLLHIYSFKLLDFDLPHASFDVYTSKGTYVRTLCYDIGEKLGCGAHLVSLRRTKSGDLSVEKARPLDEILTLSLGELQDVIMPLHQVKTGG